MFFISYTSVYFFRFSICFHQFITQSKMSKVAPLDGDHSAVSLLELSKKHRIKFKKQTESLKVCKICLEEEISEMEIDQIGDEEERDGLQLIVPCECSGSMGYVHQKCIKTWVEKQLTQLDHKRASCEICKAPLFYRMKKYSECDCRPKNILLISCCNIISAIIQFFLLVVVIIVYQYSADLYETNMIKYVLISLMAILIVSFGLTVMVMISEAFVKKTKTIGRIYTLEESIEMGLREPTKVSCRDINASAKKLKIRQKKNLNRNSEGGPLFHPIVPNINL